jgi:hypothetical protein
MRKSLELPLTPWTSNCRARDGLVGTEWAFRAIVTPGRVLMKCWKFLPRGTGRLPSFSTGISERTSARSVCSSVGTAVTVSDSVNSPRTKVASTRTTELTRSAMFS